MAIDWRHADHPVRGVLSTCAALVEKSYPSVVDINTHDMNNMMEFIAYFAHKVCTPRKGEIQPKQVQLEQFQLLTAAASSALHLIQSAHMACLHTHGQELIPYLAADVCNHIHHSGMQATDHQVTRGLALGLALVAVYHACVLLPEGSLAWPKEWYMWRGVHVAMARHDCSVPAELGGLVFSRLNLQLMTLEQGDLLIHDPSTTAVSCPDDPGVDVCGTRASACDIGSAVDSCHGPGSMAGPTSPAGRRYRRASMASGWASVADVQEDDLADSLRSTQLAAGIPAGTVSEARASSKAPVKMGIPQIRSHSRKPSTAAAIKSWVASRMHMPGVLQRSK